ncbi:hypothetical protein PRABACTJOHN_02334 [Parabacteroides johnsonii DSM 18315]|uniref:Uncharacterized protein n=1 Tax=Parabacteroides johnsonii DSM 18315 TaxID=537006 RepID=B7BBC3_9BACT|nr:hypothetical protein PRABACTJOHN_02334 [Parabacteroides johnsonii DSM 18315]
MSKIILSFRQTKKNNPMQIDMLKNITRYRNFIFMLWKMNFHEVE